MPNGNLWACGSLRRCNILQDMDNLLQFYDYEPERDTFREEVLQGLQRTYKELPSKYFYDDIGSQLFDRICELDEYYLTRTELAIR